MAWPDYSETTFAFLLLRELETKHGSGPILPTFLTQRQEAQPGAGYDASVGLNGTVHFFQFKRSEVMTHASAQEFKQGHFTTVPLFRMHLHRKNSFWQHTQLRDLATKGHSVLYVSSGAEDHARLRFQFQMQTVINHSGFFLPTEIDLPDLHNEHHVSFVPSSPQFRIYSQEGIQRHREVPNEEIFLKITRGRRRSNRQNRELLEGLIAEAPASFLQTMPENVTLRAAIWAEVRYNCQLVFMPD